MSNQKFREAVIDLTVLRNNVRSLVAQTSPAVVMAVVKANAYGHGAVPVSQAVIDAGAAWLGTADITEALELRTAGITAPILAWLHEPDADFSQAVVAGIDIGVSSVEQLQATVRASQQVGAPASIHLKLDTGLSRNGVPAASWAEVVTLAAKFERAGALEVRGMFSHLANASEAENSAQQTEFNRGIAVALESGLAPGLWHLASTAAALTSPEMRYDMVRLGIGCYGISPFGDGTKVASLGITPVMTLQGRVAAVRRVAAGVGASYGFDWHAERPTTLALVPLGYADGIPRQASGRAEVQIRGRRRRVVGRIAMDQFIVSMGDDEVTLGDPVVLFGDPATGAPSADDWGTAADTIGYEIVTRIGNRVPRTYLNPTE